MEPKDINEKYIKANFDIEAERQMVITKRGETEVTNLIPYGKDISLKDFILTLDDNFDIEKDTIHLDYSYSQEATVPSICTWDEKAESDYDVIKRLIKRERSKLYGQARRDKIARTKEEEDKKLYEILRKKYEKADC